MVNQIEFNVNNASEHVAEAKVNMEVAVEYQKKARKVMVSLQSSHFPLKTFPISRY